MVARQKTIEIARQQTASHAAAFSGKLASPDLNPKDRAWRLANSYANWLGKELPKGRWAHLDKDEVTIKTREALLKTTSKKGTLRLLKLIGRDVAKGRDRLENSKAFEFILTLLSSAPDSYRLVMKINLALLSDVDGKPSIGIKDTYLALKRMAEILDFRTRLGRTLKESKGYVRSNPRLYREIRDATTHLFNGKGCLSKRELGEFLSIAYLKHQEARGKSDLHCVLFDPGMHPAKAAKEVADSLDSHGLHLTCLPCEDGYHVGIFKTRRKVDRVYFQKMQSGKDFHNRAVVSSSRASKTSLGFFNPFGEDALVFDNSTSTAFHELEHAAHMHVGMIMDEVTSEHLARLSELAFDIRGNLKTLSEYCQFLEQNKAKMMALVKLGHSMEFLKSTRNTDYVAIERIVDSGIPADAHHNPTKLASWARQELDKLYHENYGCTYSGLKAALPALLRH